MKLALIGNFLTVGEKQDYIRSIIRCINISNKIKAQFFPIIEPGLLSEEIDFEYIKNGYIEKPDVVIYACEPDLLVYNHNWKNIAIYQNDNYPLTKEKILKLELMDEIWVPSNFIRQILEKSKFSKPIHVIPYSVKENDFLKTYPKNQQIESEKNGDFIFYTISNDFDKKYNFGALVKAFHLEFSPNEPVNLAIKFTKDDKDDIMNARSFLDSLKSGLNIRETKKEIILPSNYIKRNEIYSIHNSCEIFISTSCSENWCIPAFEAMLFGKTPIVTNYGGFIDYIDQNSGWLVDYRLEPIFGTKNYSGKQQWASICINDLRLQMRNAFQQSKVRQEKSENGINKIFDFSNNKISSLIEKVLYEKKEY